jgi:YegS/Rv2252/BmrU family lipid kinase
MSSPIVAIVNPAAGNGACGRKAPAALERLQAAGVRIDARWTSGPGEASRLAAEAWQQGARHLVAVGGDGTSYEVLNGALPLSLADGERLRLGMLPLGTGNSFLRDFSDRGEAHAVEALTSGTSRACDVIRLEHADGTLYFINLLSIGFVADVATLANQRFKKLGNGGYAAAVVASLTGLAPQTYRMRIDEDRWWTQSALFVSFCNSRYTGGTMCMAPYAKTDDGLLDVVVVGAMGRLELLAAFPRIFSGTHVHMPQVVSSQAKAVELDCAGPLSLMIDGEVIDAQPRKLELLPKAIEVSA